MGRALILWLAALLMALARAGLCTPEISLPVSISLLVSGKEAVCHYHRKPSSPKPTSLSEPDPELGKMDPLATQPSADDTEFSSVQPLGGGQLLVANHSSAFDRRHWSWREGQENPSGIYFIHLHFLNP
jgi:hypothetical protein